MKEVGQQLAPWPQVAAVFGASGGIGAAVCHSLIERGSQHIYAGHRNGDIPEDDRIFPFEFDLEDERSLESACQGMRALPPSLVIIASGLLTQPDGIGPEKTFRQIDEVSMARSFAINTIGPALVARHLIPLLPDEGRTIVAFLSARVGSISDNRLGGWHSYRASKAALNMLIRNFAIEERRTHPERIVVGLHPGTVDTALSAPFQANLPKNQLLQADAAAAHLLDVIERLRPEDSGQVFDWKGEQVPA